MRVTSISMANSHYFAPKKNINFGKFEDNKAKEKAKKIIIKDDNNDDDMRSYQNNVLKEMDKIPYIIFKYEDGRLIALADKNEYKNHQFKEKIQKQADKHREITEYWEQYPELIRKYSDFLTVIDSTPAAFNLCSDFNIAAQGQEITKLESSSSTNNNDDDSWKDDYIYGLFNRI